MSYSYANEKAGLFTESGQVLFLKIRDEVNRLLKEAGAFTAEKAWRDCTGDGWQFIACLDRMVELGEIREVQQQPRPAGQHRVFVRGKGKG